MNSDEIYIQRCFDLAILGLGNVAPNPLVGCVIVKDGIVIGEGFHQKFGGPHAEVNAINNVKDSDLLEGATLYVNLEPCGHFGKTPPCADLIIQKKIAKVVCSNGDPNPLVSGKGFSKLREAGINVVENILTENGRWLNRRFFTYIGKGRPYIILKFAETADGFIAREDFTSQWISNPISRMLTHKWRAEESAILVGFKTALCDNPSLTARNWSGQHPVRCVIDKDLKLPQTHHLFDNSVPTLVFNQKKEAIFDKLKWIKLASENLLALEVVQKLTEEKLGSVLIEGGSFTISSFISANLWDEIRVFKSQNCFEKGIKSPSTTGILVSREYIAGDELSLYKNNN